MSRKLSQLLALGGAGAAAIAWSAYRKDLKAALRRIETDRQFIEGPIEFAESGNGPAVLVVHGAGGGFDQGIDLGRFLLGHDYRIVAPSRFGYLGTPVPADASPQAQADAHARVLDALHLDRVPVIAASAGAPSAMQFALRHPQRCSALVLVVPMAYAPDQAAGVRAPGPLFAAVLKIITASEFVFWMTTKIAHGTLVETILGTPLDNYRHASIEERQHVDQVLREMLPIGRRLDGLAVESEVAANLERDPLEEIRVPTLVIAAADCLYKTYNASVYTAEHIPNATLIAFQDGGHLLVGHEEEVRSEIVRFVSSPAAYLASERNTANPMGIAI